MPPRQIKIKTGIEIWDGLPGSGKSYSSVEELIRIIIQERRPVYTNLPLKMRVLRKLLVIRSLTTSTANYIQYLDQEHFNRFIKRNQVWTKFSEPLRAEGYGQAYIERTFNELEGQPVISGPNADWIPTGSVLILDEFHRWADQRMQRGEDPAFLTYATMHRHHMHRIIIATQDAMQVSITWRRNSEELVHHTDKRKLPFIFGIPLPIPAFAREFWPKEYLDGQSREGKKPTRVEVFIPAMTGGLTWRCYDSFTHMGGARRLQHALDNTRQQVEGSDYQPEEQGDNGMSLNKKPKQKIAGLLKGVAKFSILLLVLCWIWNMQKQNTKAVTRASNSIKGLQGQITHLTDEFFALKNNPHNKAIGYRQQNIPPQVSMITTDYCMADGQICHIGQEINGFKLEKVNNENSSTLWSHGDDRFSVPLERVQPAAQPGSGPAGPPTREGAGRAPRTVAGR